MAIEKGKRAESVDEVVTRLERLRDSMAKNDPERNGVEYALASVMGEVVL